MREPTSDRAQRAPLAPTPAAYIVCIFDATLERRTLGIEVLAHDPQAQLVEIAKSRQIGRGKGSVKQVEVFLMGSVKTSIMGDLDVYPDTPALTPPTPSTAKSRQNSNDVTGSEFTRRRQPWQDGFHATAIRVARLSAGPQSASPPGSSDVV